MRNLTEREQWFRQRIGKIIYRNRTTCPCIVCAKVYANGLLVADKQHALYLADTEVEYNMEGYPLRYFDTQKEALEYEDQLTNTQPKE